MQDVKNNLDQMIRPKPLARRWGVSTVTIWRMRLRHELPEPIKISAGVVAWRESDLVRWLAEREAGSR
jgi:predicted DNA-binding transcriptional regulator AlpA